MDESSGYSVTIDEAFEFALDRLGYKKLKQEKVLRAFVSGNDVFAALPTGYGKSLCFGSSVHQSAHAIVPPTSELRLLPLDLTAFCVPLNLVYTVQLPQHRHTVAMIRLTSQRGRPAAAI